MENLEWHVRRVCFILSIAVQAHSWQQKAPQQQPLAGTSTKLGYGWAEAERWEKSWTKCWETSHEGSLLRELHTLICQQVPVQEITGAAQQLDKPSPSTRLHPTPAGTSPRQRRVPLEMVSLRRLFPSVQVCLSPPARRTEERYVIKYLFPKPPLGFSSSCPFT